MDKFESKEYHKFRTGFTFEEIRIMLWSPSEDNRDWRHITRRTVLGKWHEIKLKMWKEFLNSVGGLDNLKNEVNNEFGPF